MPAPLSRLVRLVSLGSLVAIALGSLSSRAEGQELRDQYHHAPRDTVSQDVYDGWKQYNLNCARCHGEDVQGTTIAPHLITSMKPNGPVNTKELFIQTVCAGRPAKGMPSWCALGMEMATIEKIYLYVKGRSDAKLGQGRPALKPGA
jgi:mono/diheme cytochrome c family protein